MQGLRTALSVLHLTDHNGGGAQRHLIDLCRSDADDIRHFILRTSTGLLSVHDPARNRVLVLDAQSDAHSMAAMLGVVIAELGISCIHAHALHPLLSAFETAVQPFSATPLVVTLHDLSCIDPRLFALPGPVAHADPAWIARCSPVLNAARAVIVPSAFLADAFRGHYAVAPVLIPNGIPAALPSRLPIEPPWQENTRVFAAIGAFGAHKGVDMLLQVAAAVADPSIVGVLIGYTEDFPKAGWAIPGRLYVHGPYSPEELPGLIAAYNVELAYFPNVMPESFSYVLSEAWQARIPVLVPPCGALGDRVREAGGGWVLEDPHDASLAASILSRLLSSRGSAELAAATGAIDAASGQVPGLESMRHAVEALYRRHSLPTAHDPDIGWTRLRIRLRRDGAAAIDDACIDARWPVLVREARSLREWNAKLAVDTATLQAQLVKGKVVGASGTVALKSVDSAAEHNGAATAPGKSQRDNAKTEAPSPGDAVLHAELRALRAWTAQLETDIAGLLPRNLELENNIVAVKQRNTLVEAELAAMARRNAIVEHDAVLLQKELGGAQDRLDRSLQQLIALESRASQWQRAFHRLPALLQTWLLRHAG